MISKNFWEDLFDVFDVDKNGKMNTDELKETLKVLNENNFNIDYDKLVRFSLQSDQVSLTPEMSRDEFVNLMGSFQSMDQHVSIEDVLDAFQELDDNNDGNIQNRFLKKV